MQAPCVQEAAYAADPVYIKTLPPSVFCQRSGKNHESCGRDSDTCVCPNIVMERQIRRPLWSDDISSNRSFDQFHAENRVLVHRTWHTKGTQWHVSYSSTVILLFEMEANKAPSVINSFTHVPGKELLPIRTIMQHQKWNLSQCFCENCQVLSEIVSRHASTWWSFTHMLFLPINNHFNSASDSSILLYKIYFHLWILFAG